MGGVAFDVLFAIPSHRRAHEQLTLNYLERLRVPREKIIMSVQTEQDYEQYKAAGIDNRVGKLVYRAGNCAADNRNTLLDAVPEGALILMMDDDVKTLVALDGNKKCSPITTLPQFMKIIQEGFRMAARYLTVAWGLYPVSNGFFMSFTVTPRTIIDGMFLGIVNTKIRYNSTFKTKEDYELCCRIIREYGALPRLNAYNCYAKSRSKGGCEEAWADVEGCRLAAERLLSMYPDLLVANTKRIGEVLMRRDKRGIS